MKKIALWTTLTSLFIIPFLALYVPDGMFFPFITGKNFGFRILVEIAFSAWLLLAFFDRKYRPQFSWVLVPYVFFVAWLFVADMLAVNAHKALWSNFERMDGWVTLIHVFLFFVVAGSVLSAEKLWRKWWLTFVGASFLVCMHAVFQLIGRLQINQGGVRLDATLGNAEYLAGYLLFAIAMNVWLIIKTVHNAWLRNALYALALLQLVILFQTGTRGTLIALVVAAGLGSLLWFVKAGKKGRTIALSIMAVLVVLVGGLYALRGTAVVTESPNLHRLASTFALKKELGTRLTIWGMALEGVQERPVTGWGQEGFNYVFNQYYRPSLYAQEAWFDRAHNLFIDWLIAGGIPALLFFVLLLATAFYALYRNDEYTLAERVVLITALIAYCVQGLVVFDNLLTYIPLAAILAMAHAGRARPVGFLTRLPEMKDETLTIVTSVGVVALTVVLIWSVNVPTIRAGYNIINAMTPTNDAKARLGYFKAAYANGGFASQEVTEQLLQFATAIAASDQVTGEQKSEVAHYAVEKIAEQINKAPNDARLRMQYAVLLRTYGQYPGAYVESARAAQLSPNKQSILFEQGIERLQAGNAKAATEFFTKAYELDTSNPVAASYSAAGYLFQGDVATGKALLQNAFGTTTVNQDILIYAYYEIKDWKDLILALELKSREDGDAKSAFQLAAAYSQAGMNGTAEQIIIKAMAEHPDAKDQGNALLKQLHGGK
mgnify:CR=1 FL=1